MKKWEISMANEYHDYTVGVVYAIEFGDKIKIGKTSNFAKRLLQLKSVANYAEYEIGNYVLSPMCYNYSYNEKYLHFVFRNNRVENTELFYGVTLKDVEKEFNKIEWLQNKEIIDKILKETSKSFEFNKEQINAGLERVKNISNNDSLNSFVSQTNLYDEFGNVLCHSDWMYFIELKDGNRFLASDITMHDYYILFFSQYYNEIFISLYQVKYIINAVTKEYCEFDELIADAEKSADKLGILYSKEEMEYMFDKIFDKNLLLYSSPTCGGVFYEAKDIDEKNN